MLASQVRQHQMQSRYPQVPMTAIRMGGIVFAAVTKITKMRKVFEAVSHARASEDMHMETRTRKSISHIARWLQQQTKGMS